MSKNSKEKTARKTVDGIKVAGHAGTVETKNVTPTVLKDAGMKTKNVSSSSKSSDHGAKAKWKTR